MCCCNEKNPVGTVNYFARQFPPEGWLLCDGREVSRDVFADLYNMVGTSFGKGDGKNTFNLPDLRGEFIRGLDEGRGVDSDRKLGESQVASLIVGDDVGDTVNSAKVANPSDFGLDKANIKDYPNARLDYIPATVADYKVPDKHFGAARPRNVALLACIKY